MVSNYLVFTLGLVPLWAVFRRLARSQSSTDVLPSPPVPSWLLGHALQLEKAPVGTLVISWIKKYGHIFRLRGPLGEEFIAISDPKAAAHVLNNKKYIRNPAGQPGFGRSLFSVEGTQSVKEISPILFDLAERLKRHYSEKLTTENRPVFDVSPPIHMFSLDAISMTMFAHATSEANSKLPELLHNITNSPAPSAITSIIPVTTWATNLRLELGAIAEEVWSRKDAQAGMQTQLLDSLSQVSKDEAIAQIVGILFAGSETVANVISECFYALARDKRVQNKLRQELDRNPNPTYDELVSSNSFPYLDAIMKETWRTKAVLVDIKRQAAEDDVIPLEYPLPGSGMQQLPVKKGQLISIFVRDGLNSDEVIWGPRVSEFWPERWLEEGGIPESVNAIKAPGHTMTFGDGAKICLGRAFAAAEFKIVIATIVRAFYFAEVEDVVLDFYHLGGNTIKPNVRGRESEGVQLPLKLTPVVVDTAT
ncbi:cytochrome P450 [Flagelloscypha sp. PMI_526]|nr:cytochrome P450 [Flagelloscypha sp. PMI_526]